MIDNHLMGLRWYEYPAWWWAGAKFAIEIRWTAAKRRLIARWYPTDQAWINKHIVVIDECNPVGDH